MQLDLIVRTNTELHFPDADLRLSIIVGEAVQRLFRERARYVSCTCPLYNCRMLIRNTDTDNGSMDFLSEQAVAANLFPSADAAKSWLKTDEKTEVRQHCLLTRFTHTIHSPRYTHLNQEVARGIQSAQKAGVTGVPFFVVDDVRPLSHSMCTRRAVLIDFVAWCRNTRSRAHRIQRSSCRSSRRLSPANDAMVLRM